ncbi:MAG TPA: hypothetical protein VL651_11795 [Bacteroidia bacterium]|jgi:hypothetical protein|nr:hypothetical protein [Bacteroidia bacterium]
MPSIFDRIIYVFGILFCIPYSIFLLSRIDENVWLLAGLLLVIPTGCYAWNFFRKKDPSGVWIKYFMYGLWGVMITLVLNTYILVGKPFSVTAKIEQCVSVSARDKYGNVTDHYFTYTFTNGEFANAPLLRRYSTGFGGWGEHGSMRLTFRNGIFGAPVLRKTEWIDENGNVISVRDNE